RVAYDILREGAIAMRADLLLVVVIGIQRNPSLLQQHLGEAVLFPECESAVIAWHERLLTSRKSVRLRSRTAGAPGSARAGSSRAAVVSDGSTRPSPQSPRRP